MTRFRYWLADLISGGELTRVGQLSLSAQIREWQRLHRFSDALDRIASEAKPTSNATVRRMARIAQEALK